MSQTSSPSRTPDVARWTAISAAAPLTLHGVGAVVDQDLAATPINEPVEVGA